MRPAIPPPAAGSTQLRSDPRLRGAAGLGAWNAIEWQDRIADAAAAKAGDLAIARDRIRHVAFGVEAEPVAVAPADCLPDPRRPPRRAGAGAGAGS